VFARRDKRAKEGKYSVPLQDLAGATSKALEDIHTSLYQRALAFRQANTKDPRDYTEFQAAVENGFAYSYWCGSSRCEQQIKDETKATARCIPLDQDKGEGVCICCGQPAEEKAVFGKAY